MADAHDLLHARTTQVDVAVGQSDFLGDLLGLVIIRAGSAGCRYG